MAAVATIPISLTINAPTTPGQTAPASVVTIPISLTIKTPGGVTPVVLPPAVSVTPPPATAQLGSPVNLVFEWDLAAGGQPELIEILQDGQVVTSIPVTPSDTPPVGWMSSPLLAVKRYQFSVRATNAYGVVSAGPFSVVVNEPTSPPPPDPGPGPGPDPLPEPTKVVGSFYWLKEE